MNIKLLTEHHLEFLSLKGGCTGSAESTFVKMPHCWKSHATAQMATRTTFSFSFYALKFSSGTTCITVVSGTLDVRKLSTKSINSHLQNRLHRFWYAISSLSTVVPTKRDSDEIFCLQLLSKTLTCIPLELTRIDRSLEY